MIRAGLAATALALLAAGCGGGKSGGDTDDAGAIRAILEERRANPASICEHMTPELLEQVGGPENCRQLSVADDNRDRDATVDAVEVEGDRATVRLTGADGKQTIAFVRQDGGWRLTRDEP